MISLNIIGTNMTELFMDDLVILFSYNTPVACHIFGKGFYRTNKKWSNTTTKHINKWLDGIDYEERDQEFFDDFLMINSNIAYI